MLIKMSPHVQRNHPQPSAALTLIGKQATDARAKVHLNLNLILILILNLNLNLILNPAQHYFISRTCRRPYSMTESYETRSFLRCVPTINCQPVR